MRRSKTSFRKKGGRRKAGVVGKRVSNKIQNLNLTGLLSPTRSHFPLRETV